MLCSARSLRSLGAPLVAAVLLVPSAAAAQGWLQPPDAPAANPVTAEKAVLGKILFWDEQLSSDGSMACGTCHVPGVGGSDPRDGAAAVFPGFDGVFGTSDDTFGSPGVVRANGFGHFVPSGPFELEPQVTRRYAPSTIMGAYFDDLFWDGRAGGKFIDPDTGATVIGTGGALETQSLGPLLDAGEMADEGRGFGDVVARLERVRPLALGASLPVDVAQALAVDGTYPELFERAFGTDTITPVRIAFALATYQRTLVADQSPFDEFARGDQNAMTIQQRRGQIAFETTAICAVCHTPPLFLDQSYHSLALRPSVEDRGRFEVSGNPADIGKFKTPSLRNVALRKRFFHHGHPGLSSLRDAVAVYGGGGGAFDNLDPVFNGFSLSGPVVDDLTAFLHALTDPRVEAEAPPFDRPTLRSERAVPNPRSLGAGGTAGEGGQTPEPILTGGSFFGADRFRIGLRAARADSVAMLRLRLVNPGGFAGAGGALAIRRLLSPRGPIVTQGQGGAGPAGGYATWRLDLTSTAALVGLTMDAQWRVRDSAAAGGVAASDWIRFEVE